MNDSLPSRTHVTDILLFAAVRQAVGKDRFSLNLSFPIKAGAIRAALEKELPEVAGLIQRSRLAVDNHFVEDQHEVDAKSELALIPPVSGG